ncbi:hypothetical protein STCU_01132, partial [Strigomonas culicis]
MIRSFLRPDENEKAKARQEELAASAAKSHRNATEGASVMIPVLDDPEEPKPISSTFKETSLLFPEAYAAAFEPKVQVPYEHLRGRVPRKIEIERRRRLYEGQNTMHLISISGLSLADLAEEESHKLPLEIFDDTSYDCRNPDEWMEIARGNPNEAGRFLPAEGVQRSESGEFVLVPCRVVDWDEVNNAVDVMWGPTTASGKEIVKLPRIFVRLLAEDPIVYVQRLANAHQQREKAMAWIRY